MFNKNYKIITIPKLCSFFILLRYLLGQ